MAELSLLDQLFDEDEPEFVDPAGDRLYEDRAELDADDNSNGNEEASDDEDEDEDDDEEEEEDGGEDADVEQDDDMDLDLEAELEAELEEGQMQGAQGYKRTMRPRSYAIVKRYQWDPLWTGQCGNNGNLWFAGWKASLCIDEHWTGSFGEQMPRMRPTLTNLYQDLPPITHITESIENGLADLRRGAHS
jgi:hypothetical protein